MTFGQWIKQQRERRGMLTQPALADAMSREGAETSSAYVGQLEIGRVKVPQQPFLRALAMALGVREADVLYAAGLLSEDPQSGMSEANPFGIGDERVRSAFDLVRWDENARKDGTK